MLKILIVDDHELVRAGIKSLFSHYTDLEVVAEASNAEEAITLTQRYKPDIVLMDIRLSGKSGIEATKEITEKDEDVKVIMLTSYTNDEILLDAIVAGASGYVLKNIDSNDLVNAVRRVGGGESILDPTITESVFKKMRYESQKEEIEAFGLLTNQELKILALVSDGLRNKEIAPLVFLSEKTIRNYVSAILRKLAVSNRVAASAYATKNKINNLSAIIEFREKSL